jgi:Protein of unknown function (DUF2845)
MRALLVALTLSSLFFPTAGEAASLRCGNELASEGSLKADVLLKCGEPMARESRTVANGVRVKQKDEASDTTTSTEQVVYKTVEEWTYNFGPRRLMQVAVFEDGKLVDVRSAGYGR